MFTKPKHGQQSPQILNKHIDHRQQITLKKVDRFWKPNQSLIPFKIEQGDRSNIEGPSIQNYTAENNYPPSTERAGLSSLNHRRRQVNQDLNIKWTSGQSIEIPSHPMMQTEDTKTTNTPYGRDEQLTDSPGITSRNNLHSKRSRSGERIEEWSQIFSLQQNRWKEQFDDQKARFQSNFKQNRDGSYRSVPKSRRIKPNFIIPNEYLPVEKQSVKKGLEGTKERLARDQKEARKILNKYITEDTQESPQQSNSPQRSQNYEYSLPNIQKQPAQARYSSTITARNQNQNANNSTLHRRYQSQTDLNKQVETGSRPLENSQSLGSIIYNKEDRKSANLGNKVKLPTIKHKNLGSLQNQIAATHKNSLQTNSQRNLLAGGVAGGTYEEQPFSQISTGVRSMIRDSSVQQMTTSMSNQDGGDYSMAETTEERVLQKSNTEAGPLKIIESNNNDQNVSPAKYDQNANHQQPLNTQSNEQLQAIGMHYLRNLSNKEPTYPITKSVINFNININVKESNDLYNYATKEQSKSKQSTNLTREASLNNQSQASSIRVSRKKVLEPIKSSFKEDLASQSFDKTVKMEEQKHQIGQVSSFIDQEIDNDVEKIKIKKSLSTIESQLVQSGMTLKEVVDQHLVQLYEKANMTSQQQIQAKQRQKANKSKRRFKNAERSLDFVKIVKCSAHLQPLIKFQAMLKERSKKRRQQKVASKQARKLAKEDSDSDEVVLDLMPHLKKQWPEFLDQEESINHFIEQVKQLIYLGDQHRHRLASKLHGSEYNWHQEPEMYQSSSGESKYSNEDIDQKDHLSVGESTLVNAMKKYKNADKIVQMNAVEGNDDLSSHLVYYYQEMNNKGNIPKGFGMVHRSNKPNEMDTNQVQMTDAHASAISNSLGRARYVNKLILKNVGLTDEQGIKIIQNMDQQAVRHLDISNNPLLTKAFYRALGQVLADPSSALQRLEIEGNKVGDAIIHELCAAMSVTKKIQYLNISKNKISDAGARDLAILINESNELRLLFLHYNRVMGFGGVELAEAIGKSRSLQVLDISFNAICSSGLYKKKVELTEEEEKVKLEEEKKKKKKNSKPINSIEETKNPVATSFAQLFARGFSEPWSEAFAKNKSLIHIDLSHNHIATTDVEIIAEGLKKNQQIMGIHFQGNDGEVNALGHIKAGKPLTISHTNSLARLQAKPKIKREQLEGQSEADLMTSDLNWLKRPAMQGGIVKNQETLELQLNSNCWVCEGWTEHHFVYKCGISDDNPNHDPFKPIKLHLDIDHFEGDLMMKSLEGEMVYEVYRMLPPGPHRYFFSCDGQVSIAKDHPITTQKQNKPKQQQLDTSKFSKIKEELLGIPEQKKAGKKQKVQKKKSSTGRQKEEILEELKPDYYEMDLPQVNYIDNITQTTTIFSEEYINGMYCCPRPAPKGLGNRNKVRTPWDFNLSCFASYKSDTSRLLNACFEMDWGRTKVNRIVKNEEERERFKTYFRSVYKWFREVYKFTSGSDTMGDLFCIGTNVFSTLIQEEIPTLIEGKFLKLSDLDMERISTNSNEQNSKNNPKNMLVRHNFLEVFMRLCDTKYLKNKAAGEDVNTLTKAFKTMFDTELFPAFSQYDSNIWRKTVLWKEDIDFKLKQSLPQIKAVYQRYIGKNSMPGTAQFMSLTEFTDCVLASDCLSDNFGAKQIGNQFVVSMMTQADEIDRDKHLKMTFVEFIEAIVRVAEKCEIPHCVIDEFNWGDDEIDPEMRETYAQRDIIIKLEAFLIFLVKGSLPIHHYSKLLKSWEDHQDAGLYANDLETGNFLALNGRRV